MVARSRSPVPHWAEGLASWVVVQLAKGRHREQGSRLHRVEAVRGQCCPSGALGVARPPSD